MLKQPYVVKTILAIFLLMLVVFVFSTQSSLWDRDEPYFARIACEMVQTGEWLLPRVNDKVFAEKPPFAFWAMAAGMSVFGVNAVAARLPSVLFLAATGWLVFLLGRQLFSPRAGFWASTILMSSFMPMYVGSAAMVDAPLLAFITLAMWAHLRGLVNPQGWFYYWPVLAVALGMAELTKHPVGLATVAPAACISAWMLRKDMQIPKSYWLGLLAAFAAGYALHQVWFIPVRNMTPGFAEEILGRQIVGRFFSPMEGHGADSLWGYLALFPVYVPILLAVFAPWSAFIPAGLSALMRRQVGQRNSRVFLLSWALPIFILFSLSATKLPHYILPIFPPTALLVAGTLEAWRKGRLDLKTRYWLRFGAWIYAPMIFVFGVGLCVVSVSLGEGLWRVLGTFPGLLILVSGVFGFHFIRTENISKVTRLFLAGTPSLLLLAALLTLPVIEPLIKISPAIANAIRSERLENQPVALCGYIEPSIIFYLNLPADQSITILEKNPKTLRAWFDEPGAGWLVVYDSLWQKMIHRFGPMDRALIHFQVPVLNTNDHARRELVRVVQRLPGKTISLHP